MNIRDWEACETSANNSPLMFETPTKVWIRKKGDARLYHVSGVEKVVLEIDEKGHEWLYFRHHSGAVENAPLHGVLKENVERLWCHRR